MSTFTQNNIGANSKGTQIFSSSDSHKFTQNGGGTQIIDGVTKQNFPSKGGPHVLSSSSEEEEDAGYQQFLQQTLTNLNQYRKAQ